MQLPLPRLRTRRFRIGVVAALACALAILVPAGAAAAGPTASPRSPTPTGQPARPGALGDTGDCHGWQSICYYYFSNKTPYTWHLADTPKAWNGDDPETFPYAGNQNHGVYCQPPLAEVAPGQTICFALDEDTWSYTQANIHYAFDDVNGKPHRADYNVNSNGEPVTYAIDLDSNGKILTTNSADFHTAQDADGNPLSIDAVLSHPAEATIDARKNPGTAASVMQQFANGNNQNFTPTAPVTYVDGPYSRTSALVYNTTKEKATMALSSATENSQTTSLNLEVGWSAGLNILGLVNTKVSATVDGGHSWTSSDTITNTSTFDIRPGYVGWVEAAVTSASVVGTFDFTTPESITYHVVGVTVTKPGISNSGKPAAVTWQTQQKPIASMVKPPAGRPATVSPVRCQTHDQARRCRVVKRPSARCLRYRKGVCVSWDVRATGGPVVIDARTDPKGAAAAMAYYKQATDATFTAVNTVPVYSDTDQTQVSNFFKNPAGADGPSSGMLTIDHTESSSWSVGGSFGVEVTLAAFTLANTSVSMTFSAHHEWVTSSTMSQSVTATVDPGYTAWVEGYTRQVSFTGNYSFTANGTRYQVNNVTITEPGNSETGSNTAASYIVKEGPSKPGADKRFPHVGVIPQSEARYLR